MNVNIRLPRDSNPIFRIRLDKPETLTAFSIVTEDNFAFYVPFTHVARMPPNSPCGQLHFIVICDLLFTDFDSGGVRRFQLDYAYVAWSSGTLRRDRVALRSC